MSYRVSLTHVSGSRGDLCRSPGPPATRYPTIRFYTKDANWVEYDNSRCAGSVAGQLRPVSGLGLRFCAGFCF